MLALTAILKEMKSVLTTISSAEVARVPERLKISDIRRTIAGRGQISWMDGFISDDVPRVTAIFAMNQSTLEVAFATWVKISHLEYPDIDGVVPVLRREGRVGGALEYIDQGIILGMSIHIPNKEVISLYVAKDTAR